MKNFNRGYKSGRGRDSGRSAMFQATCSECGNSCEVPFKPRGDKPVFCSDCFENQRGGNQDSRRSGGRDFRGRGFGGRDSGRLSMHQAICDQCGKECEVPFRPTKGKPVYCSDCFGNKGGKSYKTQGDNKEQFGAQFDILNAKLDKILKALVPVIDKNPASEKEATKKPVSGKKESKSKKAVKKMVSKK